jgi:hypothetical protein
MVRTPTAATAAPRREGQAWRILAACGATLAALAVGALIWRVVILEAIQRDQLARLSVLESRGQAVISELSKINAAGEWRSSDLVHNSCYTDRTNVTCTFTNLDDFPVNTCTRGKLVQKEAPGVNLQSVIMCTGRLNPSETKVLNAPWVGGFADAICYKENAYTGRLLDWSKCEFATEPVDIQAVRRMRAAASGKK